MISVIIPLYNAEKSIEKTLDSIKNQTWKGEFEIFVVNDGSTDASAAVVENYMKQSALKITLLNQENLGVSVARNVAMRLATGEYMALLDADDEWLPEKTERQMQILENPDFDIDFIGNFFYFLNERSRVRFAHIDESRTKSFVVISSQRMIGK